MNAHTAPAAVQVDGLTKRYGRSVVVDRVTFGVPQGSICGLVGPNGAGKTTVMSMLLGLVRPSSGRAEVLGHDVRRPRAFLPRVGALIEAPAFHPGLSGVENLRLLTRLGQKNADEVSGLLDLVGLGDRGQKKYGEFSLGMKQRLGIAAALLGDPDLVVLDEPTNGVDPQGMRDIRGIVREIASQGRTVLVSSHLLGELEAVCDHLVVLDKGGCRYAGPLHSLGAGLESALVVRSAAPVEHLAAVLRAGGLTVAVDADTVRVGADSESAVLAEHVNSTAHAAGIVLTELRHQPQSLEDRVLELVGAGASS